MGHIENVFSEPGGSPEKGREDLKRSSPPRANYSRATHAICLTHLGASFWPALRPTSSGHAVVPKEQEFGDNPVLTDCITPALRLSLIAGAYLHQVTENNVGTSSVSTCTIFPRRCHQSPPMALLR
jgi:hypothetical protein